MICEGNKHVSQHFTGNGKLRQITQYSGKDNEIITCFTNNSPSTRIQFTWSPQCLAVWTFMGLKFTPHRDDATWWLLCFVSIFHVALYIFLITLTSYKNWPRLIFLITCWPVQPHVLCAQFFSVVCEWLDLFKMLVCELLDLFEILLICIWDYHLKVRALFWHSRKQICTHSIQCAQKSLNVMSLQ